MSSRGSVPSGTSGTSSSSVCSSMVAIRREDAEYPSVTTGVVYLASGGFHLLLDVVEFIRPRTEVDVAPLPKRPLVARGVIPRAFRMSLSRTGHLSLKCPVSSQ